MVAEKAKSIAVAVDGSAPGWEAMNRAINMARLLALPLDVLHVIQLRKAGYFAFIDRHLQEDQEAYAQKVLAESVQRAETKGVV
ncbi:MAG: universal stress protein, partial [Deltaproteobacteria bacterium]|nr:universal stress protein [Deltaproteobacteria bacterium]